jgi:transcriptional regulator with GAF, ATPase, and Fis domain
LRVGGVRGSAGCPAFGQGACRPAGRGKGGTFDVKSPGVPTLIALFGPKRGVRLELEDSALVGRSSAADLQLIDGKVSREHCRLTVNDGQVFVEDLGSQNGTYVNGQAIRGRAPLQRNDELAVGDSLFMLDPDLTVAAARFGEATLVVGDRPQGPPAMVGAPREGPMAAVGTLAAALARASTAEASSAAVMTAIQETLAPARAFILLGDGGARGVRALEGWQSDVQSIVSGAMAVLSRTTLALAARQRRVVANIDDMEERTVVSGRTVANREARTVLVAPLCIGDEVRGFLYADRAGRGTFPLEAPAWLETIAAVCSLQGLCGTLGREVAAAPPGPAGASAAWLRVLKLADAAAGVASTVLITGESGTGKEEIARAIHQRGPRASAPFVAVNCGAIPEPLAESELFGHQRGAFTGAVAAREGSIEAADGGTLFLDEIGELPAALQVKLLRVLQEKVFFRIGSSSPRTVDLRVLAATHRDLEADVKAGRFREDLYYRLNVLRIRVPPLRERTDDVDPIADALLARLATALGRRNPGLDEGARTLLRAARWPGNARELGNVLERALVLRDRAATGPLGEEDIAVALGGDEGGEGREPPTISLPDKIAALERAEVEGALRAARGVKARAARLLGISRPTLDKKIADLGVDLWRQGS